MTSAGWRSRTAGVRDQSRVASNDPSVTLIGQAVNAVVSTVLRRVS